MREAHAATSELLVYETAAYGEQHLRIKSRHTDVCASACPLVFASERQHPLQGELASLLPFATLRAVHGYPLKRRARRVGLFGERAPPQAHFGRYDPAARQFQVPFPEVRSAEVHVSDNYEVAGCLCHLRTPQPGRFPALCAGQVQNKWYPVLLWSSPAHRRRRTVGLLWSRLRRRWIPRLDGKRLRQRPAGVSLTTASDMRCALHARRVPETKLAYCRQHEGTERPGRS
jgi:hypothetical protein